MKKKLTTIVFAISLGVSLLLAGCNSDNSKVSNGVNKMLDTTEQLSKAIENGEQVRIKKFGPKLENQWSSFEDDVKKENKDLYEKVEKYLDPTIAGSEAATIDKKALGNLNNHLTDTLKELKKKVK